MPVTESARIVSVNYNWSTIQHTAITNEYLTTSDDVCVLGQDVHQFAFALIAPLGAQYDTRFAPILWPIMLCVAVHRVVLSIGILVALEAIHRSDNRLDWCETINSWSDDQISKCSQTYDIKCKDSSARLTALCGSPILCNAFRNLSNVVKYMCTRLDSTRLLCLCSASPLVFSQSLSQHLGFTPNQYKWTQLSQWVCAQPSLHFSNMVTNWHIKWSADRWQSSSAGSHSSGSLCLLACNH